jgi:dTDP-4-amino-4,6-dideoxygalactose transaminase
MEKNAFIPFHRPSIGREEIDGVTAALQSGWLTTGERTAQFEKDFRTYVAAPYALAVNSCTAALHLALAALGIGPGDEVITTPLTFCATVNCILHVGATPVLADIDDDGNIDPRSIRETLTRRTRALLPVHYAGAPCDMDEIWTIAREKGLFVVEDAAHALSAQYRGFPIGSGNPLRGFASDAVAYSFYATKTLTTGEGGMLTSHSQQLIDAAKVLCLHGISKDAWNRYSNVGNWYYEVIRPGFKYNLSDVQSAIGIPQLQKQDRFREARAAQADFYNREFGDMEELELPRQPIDSLHAWHLYVLRLNLDKLTITREAFIQELHSLGIGASVHFVPIPMHPFFSEHAKLLRNACPRALQTYPRLVSLPIYPGLTPDELQQIAKAVKRIVLGNRTCTTTAVAVDVSDI